MGVTTTKTNKPLNPRGNDQSPLAFNRAKLYSGKALDFDGLNDNIVITDNDSLGFTTSLTATFYFNTSVLSSGNIISKYDYGASKRSWSVDFLSDKLRVLVSADGLTTNFKNYYTTTPFTDGKWHFGCFVFSANSLKIYVDGIEQGVAKSTDGVVNSLYQSNVNIAVGSNYNNGSSVNFFNGNVAGIKLFSTALTAAQVADLYNNPEKVVPTGVDNTALKLWLPMMEGAGTTAYDGSGNGNHGTISGATYVNGIGAPVSQSAVISWNKTSNLVAYSEQFDNSYWNKNTTQISLTANVTTAPDGQTTADKITNTASGSNPVIYSSGIITTATTDYVVSVYAKSAGKDWICVRDINDSNPRVWFNVSTGTIGTEITATGTIEDAGNGWYKCSVYNNGSSGINGRVVLLSVDADNSLTGTPSGTDGLFIWGASVEQSATAGPYVRTGATAQTTPVLLPQGLTTGRDITGVNLFENVRKQGALNLDGNSWAEVHDNASLDITDAITLEAWVYWDGTANNDGVLGRWFSGATSYMIYAHAGQLLFYTNTSSSAASISGTGWKHVIGTYDLVTRRMYIDGQEIGSGTAYNSPLATSDKPIEIGKYGGSGAAASYQNQIAQPRIYNRALTAEEVQRNYNAGKNTYTN